MQLPQHLCNKTVTNALQLKRRFAGVKGAWLPVATCAAEIGTGKYFNREGGGGGAWWVCLLL